MAQQATAASGGDLSTTRYAERRAPQFIGGETDPTTGNSVPITRQTASAPASPTTRLGSVSTATTPPTGGAGTSGTANNSDPYAGGSAFNDVPVGQPIHQDAVTTGTTAGAPLGAVPATPTAQASGAATAPTTRLGDVDTGTTATPSLGSQLTQAAIGAAAPYAGATLGASVGSALGSGAGVGEALGNAASNFVPNAISGLAGGGPAAAGAAGSALSTSLGASLGGGIGAGLGTLGVGLLENGGHLTREVYQPAIGSAIGFAIGNFILPGIGGFAGSFLGGMFCHAAGTRIRMEDGSLKNIEDLQIGDQLLFGGKLLGHGKALAQDLFRYKGTIVTGRHAVFEEGQWVRVAESDRAQEHETAEMIVYPLVTETHLVACEHYVCGDLVEVEHAEMGDAERLRFLNGLDARNFRIARESAVLGVDTHAFN
jgi:hypothetical protein